MDKKNRRRLAKLIFAILARNPFEYGLIPDEEGWIKTKDLHYALMQTGTFKSLSVKGLEQFFNLYRPDKMEIDHRRVRALPEFHAAGLLEFPQATPPLMLYIAVRPKAHGHVLRKGMRPPGDAKWLLLWPEKEQALKMGMRRDREPLVGTLRSHDAISDGAVFFRAGENLYLTQWLEPGWLDLPPLPEPTEVASDARGKKEKTSARVEDKDKQPPVMPGSFIPEAPGQWPEWLGKREGKRARRRSDKKNRRKPRPGKKTR